MTYLAHYLWSYIVYNWILFMYITCSIGLENGVPFDKLFWKSFLYLYPYNMPHPLSWLQTSLPLAALPFHCLITACRFRVVALSGHAALAFSPRGFALKLNRSRLSAIYRCGQSGENIDWLVRRCLPLGLLSAASGTCAVVQISPSKWGERQASLKAA